jgi:hypothetical protein
MTRLVYFQLETDDLMDVVGGQKWQIQITHLNLDVEVSKDIIDVNHWK